MEIPLRINIIMMAIADTRAGVKRVFKIIFMFAVSMGIANIVPKRGQSIQRNLCQIAFIHIIKRQRRQYPLSPGLVSPPPPAKLA
jgi:hypothetical protein